MASLGQRMLTQIPKQYLTAVSKRSFTSSSPARFHQRSEEAENKFFFKNFRRFVFASVTFCGLGVIFTYAPPFRTNTPEGRAMDRILAKDWEEIEIKEGDPGREETCAQSKQEAVYRKTHKGQSKGDVP